MESTLVTFKNFPNKYTDQVDVIALFPNETADNSGNIMSYMHVGQHGAASPELVHELESSLPWEYADLQIELESLGYILAVI